MSVQLDGRTPIPDSEVRCPFCDAPRSELDGVYIDRSESRMAGYYFWHPAVRAVRFYCVACGAEFDAVEQP